MKAGVIPCALGRPRQVPRIARHRSHMCGHPYGWVPGQCSTARFGEGQTGLVVGGLTGCYISEKSRGDSVRNTRPELSVF